MTSVLKPAWQASGLCVLLSVSLAVRGQQADSLTHVVLPEVLVAESHRQQQQKKTALTLNIADKEFLRRHFTGNFMQAVEHIPGVHSMDIGSGFSKPMIRGMAFNRIAVLEHGVKQEGQQWGADHGLELDAFKIEEVNVLKGPASLLYGSDAMGGVIEISPLAPPRENSMFGEVALLGKSVSDLWAASLMLGVKKEAWYAKMRYTEQQFGDYRIPTDTILYLTQYMPVHGRRLKNTAGRERDAELLVRYDKGRYRAVYALSNVHQKTGFFPGAHGVPDRSRLVHDGDYRNVELPYNRVNHLKATVHQRYVWDGLALSGDLGYQHNHREEWSAFHTHYGTQPLPEHEPNKELGFDLRTYSLSLRAEIPTASAWEHRAGADVQYQHNSISGYSFLLPAYRRLTSGVSWLTTYRPDNAFSVSGGVRYDYGRIRAFSHDDPYLAEYLRSQGYAEEKVEFYRMNSRGVRKHFGDYSFSLGMVWAPSTAHLWKANIGRSFRLPGANELTANGMHHGTFRHERGDTSLGSERGWQLDVSYAWQGRRMSLQVSPFVSYFENYIFLRPSGEWSLLPHAGQMYRYVGAEALFAGAELTAELHILPTLSYRLAGSYVHTYNCEERIPLSFSPPLSLRHTLEWRGKRVQVYAEGQTIGSQHRVDRNEERTPGATLLHLGGSFNFSLGAQPLELTLTVRNLFDTRYYNHLSFYRKVEIPEPGRNFQLLIKLPFKTTLK